MKAFSLLIEECFVEIGSGNMAAFAEHFPQTFFFIGSTRARQRGRIQAREFQRKGGTASTRLA
jgi:hypothetical protein